MKSFKNFNFGILFFFILIIFYINETNSKKLKKHHKDYVETEHTKIFRDKQLSPDNVRTKFNMLKNFISGVLDQLDISDNVIENSLKVPGSELIACMELFKDIGRGNKTGKDLNMLDKHIKITGLSEKLLDDKKVANAVDFIKKHISDKNLS